jgi:nucleoside 2-deoxyribosyltransferase
LDDAVRIYLAGPEVFLPDAVEVGERKKHLCAKFGFKGVFPMDAQADLAGLTSREAGLRIGQIDEQLIRTCQAIIANITPFRGPSADVGTAYEMGFGRALGLIVSAYTNVAEPFATRTQKFLGVGLETLVDPNGMTIEPWDFVDNLMLDSGVISSGGVMIVHNAAPDQIYRDLAGFEKCLAMLQRISKTR